MVEFNFEAQKVVVEKSIELRRWNAQAEKWQLLHTFPADTGQIRLIARNQPQGLQRYRFFSTTQAQIKGQCYDNDSDCDPDNNDTSGTQIGFATDEIALVVQTVEPRHPPLILDLTIVGRGTVEQTPDLPAYGGAELVTLVAAPSVDIRSRYQRSMKAPRPQRYRSLRDGRAMMPSGTAVSTFTNILSYAAQ